jgi:CRP/FNR family transcriptional regulator
MILESKIDGDPPDKKIMKYLLSFSAGRDQYEISVTQDQISQLLNFTRETINKHLKKMEGSNILSLSRGNIKILDRVKMEKLLDEY